MSGSEGEEILAARAVELTNHDPALPPEGPVEGDAVAAVLTSREAGGIATRGGAMRVAGYVFNAALGAVAAAFLFRHLGTKDVGTYVTALSIAAIVAGLSDLGLTTLGLRELSVRDPTGRARLMSNLLGLRIGLTLVGIGGSVIFAVAVGYRPVLVAGVALAGAGLLVNSVQATLALSLMSRLRLGLITATETARQALMTGLTIALVAIGTGVLSFISLLIPVGLLFMAITAWLVRSEVPLRPRFDRAEWRLLAGEVLPFAAAIALGLIYFRLSVIVVSLTASATQLSYFGLSFRILEVLIVIPGVMVSGVFPIFARSALHDRERLAYAVSRVFIVALIVGVWFTLALAIGAPVAIKSHRRRCILQGDRGATNSGNRTRRNLCSLRLGYDPDQSPTLSDTGAVRPRDPRGWGRPCRGALHDTWSSGCRAGDCNHRGGWRRGHSIPAHALRPPNCACDDDGATRGPRGWRGRPRRLDTKHHRDRRSRLGDGCLLCDTARSARDPRGAASGGSPPT